MSRHPHLLTPFGIASKHKTQLVRVGKWAAQIDRKLAPLIRLLWQHGVETSACCQGTSFQAAIAAYEFGVGNGQPTASIVFASRRDALRFAKLTNGTRVRGCVSWTPMYPDGGRRVWATNFATRDIAALTRHVRSESRVKGPAVTQRHSRAPSTVIRAR